LLSLPRRLAVAHFHADSCPTAELSPDTTLFYPKLALTSRQVPHGDGALAVHVLPRYVLHNTLDVALQYKQQGAGGERELPPAAPRAVQWPNATLPLRLCLRVQASQVNSLPHAGL